MVTWEDDPDAEDILAPRAPDLTPEEVDAGADAIDQGRPQRREMIARGLWV